jgi:hypothetical protein
MDVADLMQQVRAWLQSKPGPITEKAKELEVSYFWLQRFMKGELENITTDRLQYLVERMHAESSSSNPRSRPSRPRASAA